MDSMAEERLLRFLELRLPEEQAKKFSVAERKFLLDNALDEVDALKGATLDQLVKPPGDQVSGFCQIPPWCQIHVEPLRWSRWPTRRDGQHIACSLWPWCEQNQWHANLVVLSIVCALASFHNLDFAHFGWDSFAWAVGCHVAWHDTSSLGYSLRTFVELKLHLITVNYLLGICNNICNKFMFSLLQWWLLGRLEAQVSRVVEL